MHSFLLRHVTPQTLAIVLFVLFAVLGAIGARESDTAGFPRRNCPPSGKPQQHEGSITQSVQNVVQALKEQFNSPSLIEYAQKQGDFDSPAYLSRSRSK